jgi:hypothetical protein
MEITMKTGNIYFASDKAIYDALLQRKFKNIDLKELFLDRGIFLSESTDRNEVALYFSRLNHDYFDHQKIANALSVENRKEKTSVLYIGNVGTDAIIESSLHSVSTDQSAIGDEAVVTVTDKGLELKITYTEVNYNKSEFRQVSQKTGVILFEKTDSGYVLRSSQTDYVNDIKTKILDAMSEKSDSKLEILDFDLSDISDSSIRNKFFDLLRNGLDALTSVDVSDVYVYHPEIINEDEDSELDVHIRKVSLAGNRVSDSEQLASLYEKGFHTWKMRWKVQESVDSDRYEIEAQFDDPEHCSGFSYSILGVYHHKGIGAQPGVSAYSIQRKHLSPLQTIILSRKMELAAKKAFESIRAKIQVDSKAVDNLLGGSEG